MNTKAIIKKAISENYTRKDEILSDVLNSNWQRKTRKMSRSRSLRIIAVAAAVVLTMTMTVAALVLNRSVEFSLTASKAEAIKEDTVYITATAKNMKDFVKGIYGFTVDVDFDSSRFTFDDTFGIEKAQGVGSNFKAMANLSDENTVTILFYANDASGELSFLDKNVEGNVWDMFKLRFTVKDDASTTIEASAFTPVDCKIADAKGEGAGFELAENVTLEAANVGVSSLKRGDVNGDGNVNIIDLVRFKKYAANAIGTADFFEATADCNKNGFIELAEDMVCLRKYLLGIITVL